MKEAHTRLLITLLFGIVLPAGLYLGFMSLNAAGSRPSSLLERLGIDPDTFDVALFEDTVSPRTAWRLGLVSRTPSTEIVVVVVTSSACAASRRPELAESVRLVPHLLDQQFALQSDVVIRMVGVALDWSIRSGYDHLLTMGAFDEIIIGGNRVNVAAEKYLWGSYGLGGGTPQLLILCRTVDMRQPSITVEGEQLLLALQGTTAIQDWVLRGAVLDQGSTATAPM
jgi:hypothetical protein